MRHAGKCMPTAAFPLPSPGVDCFRGGGPGLSRKQLHRISRARVLHIIVFSLNYLYLGRFPTNEELGRQPCHRQLRIYDRIRSQLAACGEAREMFPLAPGRSGPKLAECLMHLESFIGGCSAFEDAYSRTVASKLYAEDPSLLPLDEFPGLLPYRNLCADRLRLVGRGEWQLERHLDGCLWLPFQEPEFLRHGQSIKGAVLPAFHTENKDECLKLAKLWDLNGLLALYDSPVVPGYFCKVFQVYKNPSTDRQIGDRRLPNASELRISGPSRHLPPGHLLAQLWVKRGSEKVLGSVTDRRDFYHQARVTAERARTNMLPFHYSLEDFEGTQAHRIYCQKASESTLRDRLELGDGFGGGKRKGLFSGRSVYPAFQSLFQGDHLGVEFALAGHEGLLSSAGLLKEEERLKGHSLIPFGPRWTGLIIDDFFAIGVESVKSSRADSFAFKALAEARSVYAEEGLLGSDEKDVEAEGVFKAAGAEIRSSPKDVRRGLVTAAAPLAKRVALSALSLRAACLPSLTLNLASRLAGNWVSTTMYRRCISSCVDKFFALATEREDQTGKSLVRLDRRTAQELVLLAVLAPLVSSNIAAGISDVVYASDSSSSKGAFVTARSSKKVAMALWQAGDKKGGYVKLLNPFSACLAELGEDCEGEAYDGEDVESNFEGPFKSPLMKFDFVEIFGGAGVVSREASRLGLVVAPCLDLSDSVHYDLRGVRLLEWCIHMVEEDRFGSFLLEPPCTSFSAAAHPAVRSYEEPLGFDRRNPKTLHGNTLAFRSFVLLKVGRRKRKPCGLEQPRLSKMAWTEFWASLLGDGFSESVMASCQFGSIHRKEFRFLFYLVDAVALETKCPGGHPHVKVEGKYTKDSAVYVEALGRHLAVGFYKALRLSYLEAENEVRVAGLESAVANDLLVSASWELGKVWNWRRPRHINVQEVDASVSAMEDATLRYEDCRQCFLVDSKVAQGALAKGRSSAFSLQPSLKKACAIQLAFGIFPCWGFAPTRLNVADDPTRDAEVRTPWNSGWIELLDVNELAAVHATGLKRFAANWIRLMILLMLPQPSVGEEGDFGEVVRWGDWSPHWLLSWAIFDRYGLSMSVLHSFVPLLAFGILFGISCGLFLLWTVSSCLDSKRIYFRGNFWGIGWFVVALAVGRANAAMEPASAAERQRADVRNHNFLPADRVVRKETRARRLQLLGRFRAWLWAERKVSLRGLLAQKPPDPERITGLLVEYGREMYVAGKAYGQFSETINAIAMVKPLVKRQLTAAWDLCFAWLADEPFHHHPAMPASVLLALVSVALMWGWVQVGGVLGLAWAGILRIGEVLQAQRLDLILPGDGAPEDQFALLNIHMPKTRGHGAKHQAARIDQSDIIRLLRAAFGSLQPHERLWPFSAATLRKRFQSLLKALTLPVDKSSGVRPFDLGSLRPGGATWLLNKTENSEMVRRRGRWISHKVMEVYLQEIQVATFLQKLNPSQRQKILDFAGGFADILTLAESYLENSIPATTWFYLMRAQRAEAGFCGM